ncbi:hypothetical protein ACFQ1M_14155 [Sungkyunkwania multivorans]|uniref:Uncharacterized protein n=1 Tax=Sungkyunkwania multivorans TaxID=1173618 RepID=A0ABW3CZU4_9FLAO
MEKTKLWKLSESRSDKIIALKDNYIYKGTPKNDRQLNITEETDFNTVEGLFPIPYSYIKKVINQEGIRHIKILFGNDSEEELNIENEVLKNEIFESLQDELPNLNYKSEVPSIFKYAKPQIFALLITTGIFLWALYYAVQISDGARYELVGGRPGLAGIVLSIASVGMPKLIIGYCVMAGVTAIALVRRLKTRTAMQILYR